MIYELKLLIRYGNNQSWRNQFSYIYFFNIKLEAIQGPQLTFTRTNTNMLIHLKIIFLFYLYLYRYLFDEIFTNNNIYS